MLVQRLNVHCNKKEGEEVIPKEYRTCLSCKNFDVVTGYPDYSEVTPGTPTMLYCDATPPQWLYEECEWGTKEFITNFTFASKCKFYVERKD